MVRERNMGITMQRWCWTAWLLLLTLMTLQSYIFAADMQGEYCSTEEESWKTEFLVREHFGDQTVDSMVDMMKTLQYDSAGNLSEQSVWGKSINEAVSQLTGTAINPLFGVTALGMYRYFTTPPDLREQLPFYNQSYVWGILLLVILLMLFNSTISEAMPFLKVPLNALGDLVNKGGTCIVLPVVLYEFAQVFAVPVADAMAVASSWALPTAYATEGVNGGVSDAWLTLGWAVSSILGTITYAAVWIVWNVIDVAILILPVPFLDMILLSFTLILALKT